MSQTLSNHLWEQGFILPLLRLLCLKKALVLGNLKFLATIILALELQIPRNDVFIYVVYLFAGYGVSQRKTVFSSTKLFETNT